MYIYYGFYPAGDLAKDSNYCDKCDVLGSIRKLRAKYVFTFPVATQGKYFWYKFHKGILKMFTVTVIQSLIYLLKITELLCISISVKIFSPLISILKNLMNVYSYYILSLAIVSNLLTFRK